MLAWRSRQSGRSEVESRTIAQRSAVSGAELTRRSRSSAGAPVLRRAARARRPGCAAASQAPSASSASLSASAPASTVTSVEPGASARDRLAQRRGVVAVAAGHLGAAGPGRGRREAPRRAPRRAGRCGRRRAPRGPARARAWARRAPARAACAAYSATTCSSGVFGQQHDGRGRARVHRVDELGCRRATAQQQAGAEARVEHAVAVAVHDREDVGQAAVVVERRERLGQERGPRAHRAGRACR